MKTYEVRFNLEGEKRSRVYTTQALNAVDLLNQLIAHIVKELKLPIHTLRGISFKGDVNGQ